MRLIGLVEVYRHAELVRFQFVLAPSSYVLQRCGHLLQN